MRHEARKTPIGYGNKPGSNQVQAATRAGECYSTGSYLRAVTYGIEKCNRDRRLRNEPEVPSWHPHQLRHNAGTQLRREYGLEVARVVLGHKHAAITEVSAEADRERAQEVMARSVTESDAKWTASANRTGRLLRQSNDVRS
jgi:hypothetical protein